MQNIKKHIRENRYKQIYLLCGEEAYLKKLYRDKLKEGLLGGADAMNYSYMEGKDVNLEQLMEISETLPFFAERRVVLIENSGLFKKSSELKDYLAGMCETTYLVFVESEIDKRNALYKFVKEHGYICELNALPEADLKLWMASILQKSQKKMTGATAEYLIHKVGNDMELLSVELEKVVCYALEQEVITKEDIDAVCTTQITGRIFAMMDAIAEKKQQEAMDLYHDLLLLREKPMSILFLLIRHFNILLQVKDLQQQRYSNTQIASKVGVPPFAVNKYSSQSKNFALEQLKHSLHQGIAMEEDVKTGRMDEKVAVELFIVTCSLA